MLHLPPVRHRPPRNVLQPGAGGGHQQGQEGGQDAGDYQGRGGRGGGRRVKRRKEGMMLSDEEE